MNVFMLHLKLSVLLHLTISFKSTGSGTQMTPVRSVLRDAEIKDLWDRSLLVMTKKEAEAKRAFTKKHYEMHKPMETSKYIYTLTGTGVGTVITIKCPICNAEEDITDDESW